MVATSRQDTQWNERNSGSGPRRGTIRTNVIALPHTGHAGGNRDAGLSWASPTAGTSSCTALRPRQDRCEQRERDDDGEENESSFRRHVETPMRHETTMPAGSLALS